MSEQVTKYSPKEKYKPLMDCQDEDDKYPHCNLNLYYRKNILLYVLPQLL